LRHNRHEFEKHARWFVVYQVREKSCAELARRYRESEQTFDCTTRATRRQPCSWQRAFTRRSSRSDWAIAILQ
jgi:hypothetical protein